MAFVPDAATVVLMTEPAPGKILLRSLELCWVRSRNPSPEPPTPPRLKMNSLVESKFASRPLSMAIVPTMTDWSIRSTAISIAVPPITDSCDSRTRQFGRVMSKVFSAKKGANGWQDILLFECRNCPMSREESHISRATPNRKTFSAPIVPPTIPFVRISPVNVSRQLRTDSNLLKNSTDRPKNKVCVTGSASFRKRANRMLSRSRERNPKIGTDNHDIRN